MKTSDEAGIQEREAVKGVEKDAVLPLKMRRELELFHRDHGQAHQSEASLPLVGCRKMRLSPPCDIT
jgi:hypothetical protein